MLGQDNASQVAFQQGYFNNLVPRVFYQKPREGLIGLNKLDTYIRWVRCWTYSKVFIPSSMS